MTDPTEAQLETPVCRRKLKTLAKSRTQRWVGGPVVGQRQEPWTRQAFNVRPLAFMSVALILFAGCSSSSPEPDVVPTQSSESSETSSAAAEAKPSAEDPLRPYDEDAIATSDDADDSVYITRIVMNDASIEMRWSTHDSAVEYHLHRVASTADQRPTSEAMTADNMVHVADDAGSFVDEDIESGGRYWYGLRAVDVDGVAVSHGWHRAAAVTDTEPPSPIGGLTAVADDGEVLVTWATPDENYELHGYKVLRGVDGEDLEPVTTTWNLDQTSFVDDTPPSGGTVTYAVVAIDFHWNVSTATKIDVAIG